MAWIPLELDSGAPLSTLVTIINFFLTLMAMIMMVFDISVERYCPRTNEWQTVAAMHESRSPKDSSLILSSLSSLAAVLAARMIPVSSAL